VSRAGQLLAYWRGKYIIRSRCVAAISPTSMEHRYKSLVAQRKCAGLITRRSLDQNQSKLTFGSSFLLFQLLVMIFLPFCQDAVSCVLLFTCESQNPWRGCLRTFRGRPGSRSTLVWSWTEMRERGRHAGWGMPLAFGRVAPV
jgi:hypothetical protein